MDDLNSTIQNILGSEEGMKQLQELAQMLGIGSSEASPPAEAEKEGQSLDLNSLLQNLGLNQNEFQASGDGLKGQIPDFSQLRNSFGDNGKSEDSQETSSLFTAADILKLQQLIQAAKQDNPNTMLLKSLKPLLKEERRQKVDEAVRMMKLLSLLPVLQESGMLNNLLK